jgi:ribonuclease D
VLQREGRLELALAYFAFLPIRAQLDLTGFADVPIFEH